MCVRSLPPPSLYSACCAARQFSARHFDCVSMVSSCMMCHPSFRLPATFLEAVNTVNAITDAAVARLDTLPSAYGDIAFDVDRVVRVAIDGINTRWAHALTLQESFHPGIVDNPSVLHQAVLAITHDTVGKCAPLELAAIIGNVSKLNEAAQAWLTFVSQLGIHSSFSASLKLLEACYPVVRAAAVHADAILKALYHAGSVVLPSQHAFEESLENVKVIFPVLEDELQALYMSSIKPVLIEGHVVFRNRDFALQTEIRTPTFVGFESLGEIGSEPSFELACLIASDARSQTPYVFCSNCRERPVAAHTRCFSDWCYRCDFSLWMTRPRTGKSGRPCDDHDQCAEDCFSLPSGENTERQCRGAPHHHHISTPE